MTEELATCLASEQLREDVACNMRKAHVPDKAISVYTSSFNAMLKFLRSTYQDPSYEDVSRYRTRQTRYIIEQEFGAKPVDVEPYNSDERRIWTWSTNLFNQGYMLPGMWMDLLPEQLEYIKELLSPTEIALITNSDEPSYWHLFGRGMADAYGPYQIAMEEKLHESDLL